MQTLFTEYMNDVYGIPVWSCFFLAITHIPLRFNCECQGSFFLRATMSLLIVLPVPKVMQSPCDCHPTWIAYKMSLLHHTRPLSYLCLAEDMRKWIRKASTVQCSFLNNFVIVKTAQSKEANGNSSVCVSMGLWAQNNYVDNLVNL